MSQSKFSKLFVINNIQKHYAPENSEPFSYVFPWGEYISKNTKEKFEFFLEVCPKTPNPDFVAVYLNLANSSTQTSSIKPNSIAIKRELSVINYRGDKSQTNRNRKKLSQDKVQTYEFANNKEENGKKKYVRYLNKKFLLDPQNGLFNGNKLTLNCEVEFIESVASDSKQQTQANLPALNVSKEDIKESSKDFDHTKLSEDTSKQSKVTFSLKDGNLVGNKAILALKSTAFKEMFQQNSQKIYKFDEDYKLFFEIFNFIFEGTVGSNEPNMYADLYYASVKYGIDELKVYCEDWFCSKISHVTVGHYLILGDDIHSDKLKYAAIDYIAKHKEIFDQGNFQSQFQDKVKLMREIYHAANFKK